MRLVRSHHRGKAGTWVLLFMVLGGMLSVYLYFPPFWTSWKMRKIAKDAVLTYQVTGSASSAEEKLYSGMKKEHIPFYVGDRDCTFRESQSLFSVDCIWMAPITLEIPGNPIDLSRQFSVYASTNHNGVVDQR